MAPGSVGVERFLGGDNTVRTLIHGSPPPTTQSSVHLAEI